MKKLSLYRIKELGLGSGRAVFSVQQFSNLIGKPRAIATVYMARLVDNKMAERLLRGKISFVEDDFVIATQMVEPSYISLDSALLFSGIKKQITSSVECVTTKNSIFYISYIQRKAFLVSYDILWRDYHILSNSL